MGLSGQKSLNVSWNEGYPPKLKGVASNMQMSPFLGTNQDWERTFYRLSKELTLEGFILCGSNLITPATYVAQ